MVDKISKIIIIIIAILTFLRISCRSPVEIERRFKGGNSQNSREENGFRDYIKTNLDNRLNPKISGLAVAYLVGDKSGLGGNLKEEISEIGLTHLIVISGMHLAILVKLLSDGLKPISRLVRSYFCGVFVLLYIRMIGLTPSLLRAAIVVFCQIFASYYGRKLDKSRILFLTFTITLLINPNYINSIGWQLSMLAYVGILVLDPLIEGFLFGKGFKKKRSLEKGYLRKMLAKIDRTFNFRSGLIVALAVNLMVLPTILYYFGRFSWLSILMTVILSPLMPMILFSVAMVGVLPFWIYQHLYFLFAGGIGLLESQIKMIGVFSKVQILTITVEKNNISFLYMYLVIICLYFFLRKKNIKIGENRTNQNNQTVKGSDGMQDIGTYLVEWQKQLQLRCQQYKNKTGQTEAFDNIKKTS